MKADSTKIITEIHFSCHIVKLFFKYSTCDMYFVLCILHYMVLQCRAADVQYALCMLQYEVLQYST